MSEQMNCVDSGKGTLKSKYKCLLVHVLAGKKKWTRKDLGRAQMMKDRLYNRPEGD